ncbi:MAG: DUF1127 domain-containing protein [Rhodospirillales bacterium]
MANNANICRPYTFADTHLYDRVDPIALTRYARYSQWRAMRRLVGACFAWAARAIIGWHRRSVLKRHVSEMSDHMLQDIGVRRDQIPALAAGRLERQPSALAEAVADRSLRFLDAAKRPDEDAAKPAAPIAA